MSIISSKSLDKKVYAAYIASKAWYQKRQRVLERDNYQCQMCLATECLEVHHKTYSTFGNEPLEHLITLCRSCHSVFTQAKKTNTRRTRNPILKNGKDTSNERNLAAAMRRAMLEQGLTQQDLADILEVRQPTISDILNGKQGILTPTVKRVLEHLDLKIIAVKRR